MYLDVQGSLRVKTTGYGGDLLVSRGSTLMTRTTMADPLDRTTELMRELLEGAALHIRCVEVDTVGVGLAVAETLEAAGWPVKRTNKLPRRSPL